MHLLNVLFDRIANILKLVKHNRKHFDPTRPIMIPQQSLEIWPGHVTAVDEYEAGVMLCLDISFRVLNKKTVHELMTEAFQCSNCKFITRL